MGGVSGYRSIKDAAEPQQIKSDSVLMMKKWGNVDNWRPAKREDIEAAIGCSRWMKTTDRKAGSCLALLLQYLAERQIDCVTLCSPNKLPDTIACLQGLDYAVTHLEEVFECFADFAQGEVGEEGDSNVLSFKCDIRKERFVVRASCLRTPDGKIAQVDIALKKSGD